VTLLQALPGTETLLATILQITVPDAGEHVAVPGERSSMTALPFVTSTADTEVAVRVHALDELTHVLSDDEIVFEQLLQPGPAAAPVESVVVATLPVALAYVFDTEQVTDGEPVPFVLRVSVPVPGPLFVPCGFHVTAPAVADAIDASDRAAKRASPNTLMLRISVTPSAGTCRRMRTITSLLLERRACVPRAVARSDLPQGADDHHPTFPLVGLGPPSEAFPGYRPRLAPA
jgi:hypothetical protein